MSVNLPMRAEVDSIDGLPGGVELVAVICPECFAMVPEAKLEPHLKRAHGV